MLWQFLGENLGGKECGSDFEGVVAQEDRMSLKLQKVAVKMAKTNFVSYFVASFVLGRFALWSACSPQKTNKKGFD